MRKLATKTLRRTDYCNGTACPTCGRCCDWYYKGNFIFDMERYRKNKIYDRILDKQLWQRDIDATCDYSYSHDPYGNRYLYHNRICMCMMMNKTFESK